MIIRDWLKEKAARLNNNWYYSGDKMEIIKEILDLQEEKSLSKRLKDGESIV